MVRSYFFHILLLMLLAPVLTAHADCPETPNGVHVYLGLDLSTPAVYVEEEGRYLELDLLRVQVVWVPRDPEERYKNQHVIDIDWVQQTHTNVDVWDGELQQITIKDLQPVILQTDTDFETGQVHIETCAVYDSAGPVLMFAYYGSGGVIMPKYTRVAPVVGVSAVTNATVSASIIQNFNGSLDERMIEDVGLATGIQPGHYLAESFLFQNLKPSTDYLEYNPSLFFDAENAIVMQNRVYVTDDGASLSVPLSVAAVYSNGVNILDDDHRIRNPAQYAGIVTFQSKFEANYVYSNWGAVNSVYNLIFDVRPNLTISTAPCVNGASSITADFTYPSEYTGRIYLYLGDSPEPMTVGASLYEWISCDSHYYVNGVRFYENKNSRTGKIFVQP